MTFRTLCNWSKFSILLQDIKNWTFRTLDNMSLVPIFNCRNFIKGYVNGDLYFEHIKASNSFSDWPYSDPFFLIINLAIGGEWGGIQGIDNSIFPVSFIIDYVRLYQRE